MNYKIIITLILSSWLITGCLTMKPAQEEPETVEIEESETINKDTEVISLNESPDRVDEAKKAAQNLIDEAKEEAARIKREADEILEIKTKEAEKKAEEIIASMKEKMNSDKSSAIKEYLKEKQEEAKEKTNEILESAKTKASELKNSAMAYAEELKQKGKNQSEKVAEKVIENARRAAADITLKADKECKTIKLESKKLFQSAKAHTEKVKKDADEYLKTKMAEAEKELAKINDKLKAEKEEGAKPALANSILDKILKGMKDKDYKAFTKHFTSEMATNYTEKRFQMLNAQLKDKIGNYQSRVYLGSLQKGPVRVYIWKSRFSKAKNNDLVIKLTLAELDKKEQVFAFDISNL